jgi:hypothetical protein
MTGSQTDHPDLAVRSRTNAALVFGFHSDLRRVPTRSNPASKPSPRSVPADYSAEGRSGSSLGLVAQITKWVAMLAAIAAPWVLLLSG